MEEIDKGDEKGRRMKGFKDREIPLVDEKVGTYIPLAEDTGVTEPS